MCNSNPLQDGFDELRHSSGNKRLKFAAHQLAGSVIPSESLKNVKNAAERDFERAGEILQPVEPESPPVRDIEAENLAAKQEATRTANSSARDRRGRKRRSSLSTSSAGLGGSSLSSQTKSTLG